MPPDKCAKCKQRRWNTNANDAEPNIAEAAQKVNHLPADPPSRLAVMGAAQKLTPKVSLLDTPKVRKMARRFNESVLAEVRRIHDPTTCRVYRCGICAVAKESKA